MTRVWKFPIEPRRGVVMPTGATIIAVGAQDDDLVAWATVEPEAAPQIRRLIVLGTGHQFDGPLGRFLGTVQMSGPRTAGLVFHVWEAAE